MAKAAVDGEITLLSPTHAPIFRPEHNARMTREDAAKYLTKFSLPLSLLNESPAAQTPEQASDEQTQDQGLAPHVYTAEQQALFDPLSQAGIAELFDIAGVEWASLFERAARNGLGLAREGNSRPHQYNPARVASWLVSCGHLKQGHATNRIASNLPPRSQDSKHLITGELSD